MKSTSLLLYVNVFWMAVTLGILFLFLNQNDELDADHDVVVNKNPRTSIGETITGDLKLHTLKFPFDDCVTEAKFSDDGSLLFATDGDSVAIWDLDSGELHSTIVVPEAVSVEFMSVSKDSSLLAAYDSDQIHIWETETGYLIRTLEHDDFYGDPEQMVFSADGNHLFSYGGCYDQVFVWNLETGLLVDYLENDDAYFDLMCISNDKSLMAVCEHDQIFVWATRGSKLSVD